MLRGLIINIAIFTSILFVFSHLFKNSIPSLRSPLNVKLRVGIGQGLFGTSLMFFTIPVTSTTIADLRHLSIVTAAYFGGLPAALLTGSIISISRILLFGGITKASIVGCANSLIMGLLCGIIAQNVQNTRKKWMLMNVVCIFIIFASFAILIPNRQLLYTIFLYYGFSSILGALFAGFLLQYLLRTNRIDKKLKESEERIRRLVELLPDALVVHTNGTIVYANKVAQQLLAGSEACSIIEKKVLDFVHPDSIETFTQRIKGLHTAEYVSMGLLEEKLVTLDQRVFHAEVASSIFYQGNPSVLTVFRDISERKMAEQKLKEANHQLVLLSSRDGLTGIANRRIFDETLEREWRTCQREQVPLSLIMFDIDHFKLYNDTYGHGGGDECLKKVAAAAEKIVQRPDDLVARYGGEEFTIILPNTDETGAFLIAERVRSCIESLQIPHASSPVSSVVTSSVGVATCTPSATESAEALLKRADQALYVAKNNGRNRVVQ
ncbi:PAS domain S-box-containing protein/diguanylate cyclase (GGDEF)-like protein [Aneurinibacillus soli]|uniref:Phytochrome-like protein cph2 n=1 Tax=Aneurinibacillus soli TaxID=1500254 RepID=A0A0U5BDQ9_9BACL|nr:diguanylate cyclase [Aneurinibacillus soli]PYE61767.1 PAS domain S-box-containing protein/diguanylate cyclase (GGDEF)-like protein [Aneurinibacillus soli]BAU28375.1 Phytochrome-like protein cph2 [Aneurinibacillus soli]